MKMRGHPIIRRPPINLTVRTNAKSQTLLLRWWDEGHYRGLSFGDVTKVENWIEAIRHYRDFRHDLENECFTESMRKFTGKDVRLSRVPEEA